jgi:hypothetical protein
MESDRADVVDLSVVPPQVLELGERLRSRGKPKGSTTRRQ